MKLRIADNLALPADAVTQTFAYLARRGAGKSYLAKVVAEEMLKTGSPIVVLDPTGVWWGLRAGADGSKSGGFPVVILGGDHADVPLEPTAGKVTADFLVAERVPAILDLSRMGETEMQQFVADFAERFYRTNSESVHWFVDEADEFAPQDARGGGPLWKCLGAMQRIVRRGRVRGLGVTLITQRSAVLNKSVLTQTECLVALQTTAPQDLNAVQEWLKYHGTKEETAAIMAELPKLGQGEAFVYSPAWMRMLAKIKVRPSETFDSMRTPKPGEKTRAPKSLADVDLVALGKQMAATIEKAKADDPKVLRAQLAELKKQVAAAAGQAPGEVLKRERAKWEKEVKSRENDLQTVIKSLRHRLAGIEVDLRAGLAKAEAAVSAADGVASPPVAAVEPARVPRVDAVRRESRRDPDRNAAPRHPVPQPAAGRQGADDARLERKAERSVLTVLAQYPAGRSMQQTALLAGYARNGGGFKNAIGRLRSMGWIDGHDPVRITDAGLDVLGPVPPLPSGAELREHWNRQLKRRAEREVFIALCEAWPDALSREDLAQRAGYEMDGGGFKNAVGKLRTLELVEGRGELKASDTLFDV